MYVVDVPLRSEKNPEAQY